MEVGATGGMECRERSTISSERFGDQALQQYKNASCRIDKQNSLEN